MTLEDLKKLHMTIDADIHHSEHLHRCQTCMLLFASIPDLIIIATAYEKISDAFKLCEHLNSKHEELFQIPDRVLDTMT